jgi:DNA primase
MPDPVVDAIKSRIDIAELVGAKVNLRRAGKLLKGLCPFHQERSPSFVVYPDEGRYHCFGCAKSGDAFTWLRDTQGLDFADALKELSRRTGVPLPERAPREVNQPPPEAEAARQALAEATRFYQRQLIDAPDAGEARAYLRRRGITRGSVDAFALGWAPEGREVLLEHLVRKGFSFAHLELAGLAMSTDHGRRDRFRARVIFPIRDRAGEVIGFGARTLGDAQPKYLNSPQTPFFDKGSNLYGLDLARGPIRQAGAAVIVEGYMDVVVPHQEGFRNVVASLGTALTDRQIELLKRYTRTIVLALDADVAGQAATLRGLEVARVALSSSTRPAPGSVARGGFLATQAGQVKIAVLTGGKDPDEIVREDPERWKSMIADAVPMMDHKIAIETASVSMDDPGAKLQAVRELARFLALVPDPVEWSHYVDRIAQRLRLDVRAVHAEVVQAEEAMRRAQRFTAREQAAAQARAATSQRPPLPETGDARAPDGPVGEAPSPSASAPHPDNATRPDVPSAGELFSFGGASYGSTSVTGSPSAGSYDPLEQFVVSELVAVPDNVGHVRHVIAPDDLRDPGLRALFEEMLAIDHPSDLRVEGYLASVRSALLEAVGARPAVPADGSDDPEARRAAAVVSASLRLRERRLREKLRDVQYLLREDPDDSERTALQRQVEQLATSLGRVHLEQNRAAVHAIR